MNREKCHGPRLRQNRPSKMATAKSSPFSAAQYSSEGKQDQYSNSTFSVWEIQAHKVTV